MHFIQSRILVLFSLVVCGAALSIAPGYSLATTKPLTANNHVYLPLTEQHIVPSLVAPADGEHVVSLAPILSWFTPITGTFRIEVSPDPTFSPINTLPLSETKKLELPLAQETLITSNLTPNMIYYWRIGIRTPVGYEYAQARSFTTPAKNAALLPAVVPLISPADQTILPSTSVLLQWQNVPTALYYRVRVFNASGVLFAAGSKEVQNPTHSLDVTGLQPGMAYTWKVKALNMYGWGNYSAIYHFTVP
jgi:hypothetical protein